MHFKTCTDARTWYENSGIVDWDHGDLPFDADACVDHIYRHVDDDSDDTDSAAMRAYCGYLLSIGADLTDYDGTEDYR